MGHHVGLVQDYPDLVVVLPDRLKCLLELVRNVQLVSVDDENNPGLLNEGLPFALCAPVILLCEQLEDPAVERLLLPGQDARGVQ